MLAPTPAPASESNAWLRVREDCGLAHERQVVRIGVPAGEETGGFLRGLETGARYPVQRSRADASSAFVEIGLAPFEQVTLVPDDGAAAAAGEGEVTVREIAAGTALISNGLFSLEVPLGETVCDPGAGFDVPGPVERVRVGVGAWRGRTFLDTRRGVRSYRGEVLERGPVRVVYRYRAELAAGGFYEAAITVDRGQVLAGVEEEFRAGSGDQVVWDFAGADLPEELYLLDSTAGYQTRPLLYGLDQRHTRLLCWTQQSQHFDFSDGYALGFAAALDGRREIAGFVALEGGRWRGNKLNHLEAWSRRWFPGDAGSRRGVAPEAKADGQPSPERIPARGQGVAEPHFNVEGWIGQGRRKWALVLTTADKIQPADATAEPLGYWDVKPDRERYRRRQSLLRRIHTQRGLMPLQEMLGMEFAWEEEAPAESSFTYPHEILSRHFEEEKKPEEARASLMDYLAARVYGFWEGSGSAYTNPVVSRRVAPEMFRYEWLVRQGALGGAEKARARAHFAFLLHLFASENYYAGEASMQPVDSPEALDPTLAGMANQNFYTDVFNIPGTGAQVFWKHPRAGGWRELFGERWRRQLEYHMYPESGVWEESHTYYHHILHTVLPLFLRRRADGVEDEFARADLQKFVGGGMKQLTPPDAFFDGCRHAVIFGDHGVEVARYRYLWREFAEGIEPHNPRLAGHLAWAYAEMRGRRALRIPARAREPRNEHLQGLGAMFRGVDADGHESLLALRGGAAWGHHHNDDGSIQFYAKGRAMIVDAAFGEVQENGRRKFEAAGHSRWTLKNVEPVDHLWRFSRGWITDCELAGPLAFATSYSPGALVRAGEAPAAPARMPAAHFRTVVQINPATFLVIDAADPGQEQAIFFHVPGSSQAEVGAAGASVAFEGGWRLHMRPLMALAAPKVGVDRPKNPEAARYTTTSLEYAAGPGGFSAFLMAAQRETAPAPEISGEAGAWAIRGEGLDLILKQEGGGELVLTDRRAKVLRVLDPWQTGRGIVKIA